MTKANKDQTHILIASQGWEERQAGQPLGESEKLSTFAKGVYRLWRWLAFALKNYHLNKQNLNFLKHYFA